MASIDAPRGFANFNASDLAKPHPFCRLSIVANHDGKRTCENIGAANHRRFCHEKTDTDAIFENVQGVRIQAEADPETLEILVDT